MSIVLESVADPRGGQADAAIKAGTSPQDEARGAFAFAGLVFDLDACTLKRESGEAIALTRASPAFASSPERSARDKVS
jgi:hypothetical protein